MANSDSRGDTAVLNRQWPPSFWASSPKAGACRNTANGPRMVVLPPRGPERIESSSARCLALSASSARTGTRGWGILAAGRLAGFFAGFLAGLGVLFAVACCGRNPTIIPSQGAAPESTRDNAVENPVPPSPLCFVLMPFGRKTDATGRTTDFDAVYQQIIAPAVVEVGLDPLRAD